MTHRLNPPKPEDFGLNQEKIEYFTTTIQPSKYFVSRMVWVSFIVCLVFFGEFITKGKEIFFISGIIIGLSINGFWKWFNDKKKRWNPDYPRYGEFENEYEKYSIKMSKIYLEERRYEQIKTQIEREEKKKQIEWWKSLSGYEFKKEVTSFLKEKGYNVKHTGKSGDGGIYILLNIDEKTIIIQCICHKNYISSGHIRDLYGTVISMGVDEGWLITTSGVDEGWLITTSGVYGGSKQFFHGKPIRLFTINDLLNITKIEK